MSSTAHPSSPTPGDLRRRRRVLAVGVLGLVGLGGAIEGVPRIEGDLERRVENDLRTAGIDGVNASFSGQDGRLHCVTTLDDPTAAIAVAVAEDVWGVRVAELDGSCGAGSTSATETPAAASATTQATDSTDSTAAPTTSESTDQAAITEVPANAGAPAEGSGPDVTVELANGVLSLRGAVPDEADRARLVAAAEAVVDPANVDDRLVADPSASGEPDAVDAVVGGLAELIDVMPGNLVSGTARLVGGELTLDGVYVDAAALASVDNVVATTGAAASLVSRETASASDATALADELNALVAADPILFEPGSVVLTADASAVVDRVAAVANRFDGLAIDVIGHTDSDGDEARNLDLSQRRARSVGDALQARGVTATLTATGLGETELVVVGGVEDKAASRRVVFAVVAD